MTNLFKRVCYGVQGTGYAVATGVAAAATIPPATVALAATGADYVVPAKGVQKRWEKITTCGIDGTSHLWKKAKEKFDKAGETVAVQNSPSSPSMTK